MNDNKINKILKQCFITLVILLLIAWALFNFNAVSSLWDFIMKVLTPFLIGGFIALLLNVPLSFFENILKKKFPKNYNWMSLALSIIIIILVVAFVLFLIIPKLIDICNLLIQNIPAFKTWVINLMNDLSKTYPDIDIQGIKDGIIANIDTIKNSVLNVAPDVLLSSVTAVTSTVTGIINFFIGIGFAFILLTQKDIVSKGVKKVLYGFVQKERANKIVKFCKTFTDSFNKFIVAQCLDGLILGILTIVVCAIFQIPNCVPIGVLVGFTSLIPIFGVFIGIAIGIIIIIFESPIKALVFLVLVILAWQLVENFIKPIVVGKKVGISNLWLFVATIAGGTAFGVLGIIFAVPTIMAVSVMIDDSIKRKKELKTVEESIE